LPAAEPSPAITITRPNRPVATPAIVSRERWTPRRRRASRMNWIAAALSPMKK